MISTAYATFRRAFFGTITIYLFMKERSRGSTKRHKSLKSKSVHVLRGGKVFKKGVYIDS